jgi:hypothetical protein
VVEFASIQDLERIVAAMSPASAQPRSAQPPAAEPRGAQQPAAEPRSA